MVKKIILIFCTLTFNLSAFEKLPEKFLVTFGEKSAPLEIVQFYSLSCPHCIRVFNEDFQRIREEYIENGKLRYILHPVPMDLTTVQLMCCLEKLNEDEKKLFLKVLLEELSLENPDFNVTLMKHAMELFGHPLKKLNDDEFIKASSSFKSAGDFVTQENSLETVPSVQIGNSVIEKIPDYAFVSSIMNHLFLSEADYEH